MQIPKLGLKSSVSTNGRRAIRPSSRAKKPNKASDQTKTMSTQSPKTSKSPSSVGMFSPGEARCDRWQELAHAGQTLVAQSSRRGFVE